MRLFEGTGTGCLMITNHTKDLKNFFNDDELVSYSSKEDALEKIKYFLDNPKELLEISEKGRVKTHSKHTYKLRVTKINEILNKHI